MFIQMLKDWDKDYKVERHLNRLTKFLEHKKSNPSKGNGVHRHHIIPRSWAAEHSEDSDNLVYLTAREHLFVHYMMVKAFPKNVKMTYTLHRMAYSNHKVFDHEAKPSNLLLLAKQRLSGAYSHSPETIAKILVNQGKLSSPIKGKKAYNNGKLVKFYFEGEHPEGWGEGNLIDYEFERPEKSELTLLKTSLLASSRMKERIENGESLVNMKGEDNPLTGIRRFHDPLTLENFTFREGDEIPEGLISGHYIPNEQERREKISEALTGRKHDWQDKINKNPEKIRKTSEFHRGRKRPESTRQKQSEAKRRFFDEGGIQHNKGKKCIYNINTLETSYAYPDEVLEDGWAFGNLGTKKFWFESSDGAMAKFTIKKAPEGWKRIVE